MECERNMFCFARNATPGNGLLEKSEKWKAPELQRVCASAIAQWYYFGGHAQNFGWCSAHRFNSPRRRPQSRRKAPFCATGAPEAPAGLQPGACRSAASRSSRWAMCPSDARRSRSRAQAFRHSAPLRSERGGRATPWRQHRLTLYIIQHQWV